MVKLFTRTIAFVVILSLGWRAFAADNDPLTVFATDISLSSPFLSRDDAARQYGEYARQIIRRLHPGHELHITTLGIPGFSAPLDLRARIGNESRTKARILANGAYETIASIPGRFKVGDFPGQDFTSIVDFFESFAAYDFTARPIHIIVATDGVEWTPTFDGQAFAAGKIHLPAPEKAFLKGCQVTMLGVGADLSVANDRLYGRLAPQWRAYLKAAGAVDVKIAGTRFGD